MNSNKPKACSFLIKDKKLIQYTAQKMKFSFKEIADLVTFTEEILNGKLHFLRRGM